MSLSHSKISKQDISKRLQELNNNLAAEKIDKAVSVFFNDIITALIAGDRVEIRGLCSMMLKKPNNKISKNLVNNKLISVEPNATLYFRASKGLLEQLNKNQ